MVATDVVENDYERLMSDADADPRLAWLIDAWQTLSEDVRDELAELAGFDPT